MMKRTASGALAMGLSALIVAGAAPAQAALPAAAGTTTTDTTTAGTTTAEGRKPGKATRDAVAAVKRATTARIDGRLAALRAMDGTVDAAENLTDAHRETLRAVIEGELTGLTTLREQVQAATTVAEIKALARNMVTEYRVYMLVRQQVHHCVAADAASAALARLRQAHDELAATVAEAEAAGKPTGDAAEHLAAMLTNLDAAEAALAGTADALLEVKPGPDSAAILEQVSSARAKIHTARKNLRQAGIHAKRATAALRRAAE